VEEKIKFSDKIIDNSKDVECTKRQVRDLWEDIRNFGGKPVA
jgi:dephospho-CoA kinase